MLQTVHPSPEAGIGSQVTGERVSPRRPHRLTSGPSPLRTCGSRLYLRCLKGVDKSRQYNHSFLYIWNFFAREFFAHVWSCEKCICKIFPPLHNDYGSNEFLQKCFHQFPGIFVNLFKCYIMPVHSASTSNSTSTQCTVPVHSTSTWYLYQYQYTVLSLKTSQDI